MNHFTAPRAATALFLLLCILLGGCAPTRLVPPAGRPSRERVVDSSLARGLLSPEVTRERLEAVYRRWKGVPYAWGGGSTRGIDCSGFIHLVFLSRFGLRLPRTVREQARVGMQVPRGRERAGDLVFFKTGRQSRHAGIYLENGRFIHVGKSSGVTISSLGASYWKKRYWMSRRPWM